MKTFTLFACLILCSVAASAQADSFNSGKITYEERVKIEIKLDGDGAALAENLPKERRMEKILTFDADEVLFEDGASNVEDEMAAQDGHGTMRIRMVASGENKSYINLTEKKVIEQRDFMNRIFLVEKEIPRYDWKFTGKQKMILGHNCFEAVKTDTAGVRTVAWFAPSIKIGGGPAGLCNLPGMILEADINNGSRVYIAKSIQGIAPDEIKIQRPKEGREVTEEEYREIVDEKMKEMGTSQGDGNQVRVIIRHQ